jgi:hypothetical protein
VQWQCRVESTSGNGPGVTWPLPWSLQSCTCTGTACSPAALVKSMLLSATGSNFLTNNSTDLLMLCGVVCDEALTAFAESHEWPDMVLKHNNQEDSYHLCLFNFCFIRSQLLAKYQRVQINSVTTLCLICLQTPSTPSKQVEGSSSTHTAARRHHDK